MNVRRATCLIAYWDQDQFVLENYLSHAQASLTPRAAQLLPSADRFVDREAFEDELAPVVPDARSFVDSLVEQNVLLVEGSGLDRKDRAVASTWRWGQDARYFHYSTQDISYEPDGREQRRVLAGLAADAQPPSAYKGTTAVDIPLPRPPEPDAGDLDTKGAGFWDVLDRRRTVREFSTRPLGFRTFATLVWWTWAAMKRVRDPILGEFPLKTSPSGGARHPMEVYPVILRVDGVRPGIYHYSVEHHGLRILKLGLFQERIVQLCSGDAPIGDAAVVFLMTAVVERSMWKYRHAHAYRVMLLDAGHVGQTFHLVCTALDLAPWTLAAVDAPGIEAELGLDGVSEVPTYVGAVGLRRD